MQINDLPVRDPKQNNLIIMLSIPVQRWLKMNVSTKECIEEDVWIKSIEEFIASTTAYHSPTYILAREIWNVMYATVK